MKRALLLAVLLVTSGLAGCIGNERTGPADALPASTSNTTDLNPWQRGLTDDYPTPDVAVERSAEEREANVAEPGDPAFASFDATMEAWMTAHDIPTGQLAVMKDGELRYTRGYGHTDRNETEPADGSTMFRVASVSKPFTAALVKRQIEQGLYERDDPVFCLPPDPAPDCRLPIDPHPGRPVVDDRLADVQVGHLLEHTGGWDRTQSGDVFFEQIAIAEDLDVESPPDAWRFAQWMIGEELDHEPGTTYAYSNAGYVLLGLVAEAATGAELEALYEAYLFEPLEIAGDIEQGHILPGERNEREPFYVCEGGEMRNIHAPNETVCPAQGGWSMAGALGAPGGLIATADAISAFFAVYDPRGEVREDGFWNWRASGSMPGTAAFNRILHDDDTLAGDLQFTVLFNKRGQDEPTSSAVSTHDVHDPLLPQAVAWAGADTMEPTSS